jgi:ApaG protein
MPSSESTTNGIRIAVTSFYVESQSNPRDRQYAFAYKVRIENKGETPAQLISRHWVITDGVGRVEEVKGPGVIGEQPRLGEGEAFEYTSWCPLTTPSGTMRGTYQMVRDDAERFDAVIAPFVLAAPGALN